MSLIKTYIVEPGKSECKEEAGDPVWHDEHDAWKIRVTFDYPKTFVDYKETLRGIIFGKTFGYDIEHSSIRFSWKMHAYPNIGIYIMVRSGLPGNKWNKEIFLATVKDKEAFTVEVRAKREENYIFVSGSHFEPRTFSFIFVNGRIKTQKRGFSLYYTISGNIPNPLSDPLKCIVEYEPDTLQS